MTIKEEKVEKLTKVVNFRISEQQEKEWKKSMKAHRFKKLSSFIRWCVDEVVEGSLYKRKDMNNKEELKEQIKANDKQIQELMKSQKEILKLIAQTRQSNDTDQSLRGYQKGIILNLIQQKPRDEEEINKILDDLTELDILDILNDLMDASLIKYDKNKYRVI